MKSISGVLIHKTIDIDMILVLDVHPNANILYQIPTTFVRSNLSGNTTQILYNTNIYWDKNGSIFGTPNQIAYT